MKDVKKHFELYVQYAGNLLIDTVYFVFWIFLQWIVDHFVLSNIKFDGLDRFVLTLLQILFAASTFIPVGLSIYSDIRKQIIHISKDIEDELEKKEDKNE